MGYVIKIGANCSAGQVLNLTEACHGLCNYFPEDPWRHTVGERSFLPCNVTNQGLNTTQCIREGELMDGGYDCDNRADEDPFHSGDYDLNLDLPSLLVPCREGYKCSGSPDGTNCLSVLKWCDKSEPYHCDELNRTATSLSSDTVLCSNQSYWEDKPCLWLFNRCTGKTPGQCWDRDNPCSDGSHLIKPANNWEGGDSAGKKQVICRARDGKFKGEPIFVEEHFICDNSLQCMDGADEAGCDEEYVRKKIFTINDKHPCNSVYLNITRSDGRTGHFYPQRGIRCLLT